MPIYIKEGSPPSSLLSLAHHLFLTCQASWAGTAHLTPICSLFVAGTTAPKGLQGEGTSAAAVAVGKRGRQEEGANGSSSDGGSGSTSSGGSEQTGKQAAAAAPPAKRSKMLAMLEDVGVSSDDESSDEEGVTQV